MRNRKFQFVFVLHYSFSRDTMSHLDFVVFTLWLILFVSFQADLNASLCMFYDLDRFNLQCIQNSQDAKEAPLHMLKIMQNSIPSVLWALLFI